MEDRNANPDAGTDTDTDDAGTTAEAFPVEALRDDGETRLEFLVEAGVVDVDEHDSVGVTGAFDDRRRIYADSYADIDDEEFARSIADVFGTSIERARTQIEETDLTREDLYNYLSLQSHLDRDLPQDVLVLLTSMVVGVGVGSAVPDSMQELDDDSYEAFLDAHDDAVLFVWSYPCDPCRTLKQDLPDLLAELPDSVAVAGVDGDSVGRFRTEFEVTAAPTILLFAGGNLVETIEGYHPVGHLLGPLSEAYDGVSGPGSEREADSG
jgi:thiol-disulfide isomerase/thioredoxin